jgi:hypothetical protein
MMRVCKPNETGLIFGQGGPSMMGGFGGGFESAKSSATQQSTTPTSPTTTNPTFTVSPEVTGPTYNGQTVNPVFSPTTVTTVTQPTAVISGQTTPSVDYYDNGVMCIDPGAVNTGPSSGLGQTDTGLAGNADFGGIDTSNMA